MPFKDHPKTAEALRILIAGKLRTEEGWGLGVWGVGFRD